MAKRRAILLKEDDEGFQAFFRADYTKQRPWEEIVHFDIPVEAAGCETWLREHMRPE